MSQENDIKPPIAKIIPKKTEIHGYTLTDNYYWLREKTNQEVIDYLNAENKYTESVMEHTKELQKTLYDEMIGRIKETDMDVPKKLDNYYYYTRTEKDKQYSIFCRKKDHLDNPEEILLDINLLAEGKKYCRVGISKVSPNHNLLAYGVDFNGSEDYTIFVKDLINGKLLSDEISDVTYGFVWANNNKTFYYTKTDDAKRASKIYKHNLGANKSGDELLFYEKDETYRASPFSTMDNEYLLVISKSMNSSEVRYLNKNDTSNTLKILYPRETDIEYFFEHRDGKFYILTNKNAINFKLVTVSSNDPKIENWKELIPHNPKIYLYSFDIFKNHLVSYKRINGITNISIYNFNNNNSHDISFEENLYTLNERTAGLNLDYNSELLRFKYSSLITPDSIYDYNMNDYTRELKKQEEIIGYKKNEYTSKREIAITDDNEEIFISIVYKKDLDLSKTHPVLLNGYGSYGIPSDPGFRSNLISLLNRGIIFAIGHVRGGGENGKPWYNSGKLFQKKNTFTDFIRCAEHLITKNYTKSEQLIAMGGSAGGLLMGAVVNMRPELFKAIIAHVPFVDVINTMLDETIPLTVPEFNEWGNPKDKAFFDYMLSYSPLDNVTAKNYPSILITAGLNDPRVQYWEPAKWIAKLRATKTNSNLILLKTNMGAGHGGSSGRYDYLKEIAFYYAYLLNQIG